VGSIGGGLGGGGLSPAGGIGHLSQTQASNFPHTLPSLLRYHVSPWRQGPTSGAPPRVMNSTIAGHELNYRNPQTRRVSRVPLDHGDKTHILSLSLSLSLTHTHTHTHTHTVTEALLRAPPSISSLSESAGIYVHMYVCMYVCVCVCIHTCIYTCIYTHVVCVCVCVCMCVCVYIHVYIHIYTHVAAARSVLAWSDGVERRYSILASQVARAPHHGIFLQSCAVLRQALYMLVLIRSPCTL
jgi:hypothetical protein